ncbi:MAG TPA: TldD/PmbA family protein [Acidobacteriota bacterium]|nr:TldD/PmbA family protein [Acidobacteriota bacterium]
MNSTERLALAHWAVDQAKKSGADEAAVNVSNSRDIEVEIREQKVDKLKESTQNSLSIDVYVNQRYSSQSTNDLRKDSLSRFISEAVAMAKYLTEDEYRRLPDPKYYEGRKETDLKIYDDSYDALTSAERVEFARAVEEAARSRSDRIITCTAGFSDSEFESAKVHSNEFEGTTRGTVYSAGAEATVRGEGDGRPSDWEWRTFRFRKDMPAPEELGRGAVDRALTKVGQKKMESGVYEMVIDNRSASRFLGSLQGPMRASSIQQQRSFLADRLGEKIASDAFTLIDDPFVVSGFGSRLYDGEGMATQRRVMIDKGVLKSYYVDCYYGRKLGMEPTIAGPTNMVFAYGDKSLEELVAQMQRGILITGFIGGNSNSTTGDFSLGIIGTYVENGQRVRPVNEMNISGNLTDALNNLVAMGNDPWVYSSLRRPSMHFRDIQFSGV